MKTKGFIAGFLFAVAVLQAAPASPLDAVRFEQRIGNRLPLETQVVDPDGVERPLGAYFRDRPVVLYFGYAACPQLCSLVADGTVAALRQIAPAVGQSVDVVAVSIDPGETAAAARGRVTEAIHRYGDPASVAGWHYLRGSEAAVRAITDAAGFHFIHDSRSNQYGHPSGFVVVTPAGVISRYFLGVDFDATDTARAIHRAAEGKTGEPVLDLLLRCFRGDGSVGPYGVLIRRVLATGVIGTVLILAGSIGWMLRAEWKAARRPGEATP